MRLSMSIGDELVSQSVGYSVRQSVGRSDVRWLVGRLVGRSVHRSVGRTVIIIQIQVQSGNKNETDSGICKLLCINKKLLILLNISICFCGVVVDSSIRKLCAWVRNPR